jgi:hypothetical protein
MAGSYVIAQASLYIFNENSDFTSLAFTSACATGLSQLSLAIAEALPYD